MICFVLFCFVLLSIVHQVEDLADEVEAVVADEGLGAEEVGVEAVVDSKSK